MVVENRVTPKWVALVNGNMDDLTCGPIPGGLILTHTHRSSSREVRIRVPTFSVVYFSRGTLPKKRVKGTTERPRLNYKKLPVEISKLGVSVTPLADAGLPIMRGFQKLRCRLTSPICKLAKFICRFTGIHLVWLIYHE